MDPEQARIKPSIRLTGRHAGHPGYAGAENKSARLGLRIAVVHTRRRHVVLDQQATLEKQCLSSWTP